MNIPKWMAERNARFVRERIDRDDALRAAGNKLIACVSFVNPRTDDNLITTTIGPTETLVITNMPDDCIRYGIGCVVVGPESAVIENANNPIAMARKTHGVVLRVFTGKRPA